MERKIMLLMFILSLFILSSCTTNDVSIPVHKGYSGLELEFSKTTPDKAYENTSFYSRIIVNNKGSYSVNVDESPAFVSLTTDKLYLQHDPWPNSQRSFYVMGRSSVYPQGDSLILDLPELRVPSTEGNLQNPKTDLFVNLCYPYRTTFSENVCLDFDLYNSDQRTKVCTAEQISVSGGQGAPIAITNIVPLMKADQNQNLRPEFIFTIENKGSGTVAFDPSKNTVEENTCFNINQQTQNWNRIKVFGTISNIELDCSPNIVRLIDGKAEVRCIASDSIMSQTNFYSPLTLNVDYLYMDTFSKSLDIIRDLSFADISYTVHQNCENRQKGDSCGINMVCNENLQCLDKCTYCSSGGESIRGKVNCSGINADFSCSCSSVECEALNDAECKKGYCEVKQCCNPALDSRPLGAAYTFKDDYSYFINDYATLNSNTKLNHELDYRFKPVHPNSNTYCGLELYDSNANLLTQYQGFPKPCAHDENFLDYTFSSNDRGKSFLLVVKTFDEHDDADPSRTDSIVFEIEDPTPNTCDIEGKIIDGQICINDSGEFRLVEKCNYCNIDPNKDFCQDANFVEGMSCSCTQSNLESHIYSDPDLCKGNIYCCIINDDFEYEFYVKISNGEDIIFDRTISYSNPIHSSFDVVHNLLDTTINFGSTSEGIPEAIVLNVEGLDENGDSIDSKTYTKSMFDDNEIVLRSEETQDYELARITFETISDSYFEDLLNDVTIDLNFVD